MQTPLLIAIAFFIILMNSALAANDTVAALMNSYMAQGANIGRAETGKQLWQKTFTGQGPVMSGCHWAIHP